MASRTGVVHSAILTGLIVLTIQILGRRGCGLFLSTDSHALDIAEHIIHVVARSAVFLSISLVLLSAIAATGAVMAPLIIQTVAFVLVGFRWPKRCSTDGTQTRSGGPIPSHRQSGSRLPCCITNMEAGVSEASALRHGQTIRSFNTTISSMQKRTVGHWSCGPHPEVSRGGRQPRVASGLSSPHTHTHTAVPSQLPSKNQIPILPLEHYLNVVYPEPVKVIEHVADRSFGRVSKPRPGLGEVA